MTPYRVAYQLARWTSWSNGGQATDAVLHETALELIRDYPQLVQKHMRQLEGWRLVLEEMPQQLMPRA